MVQTFFERSFASQLRIGKRARLKVNTHDEKSQQAQTMAIVLEHVSKNK